MILTGYSLADSSKKSQSLRFFSDENYYQMFTGEGSSGFLIATDGFRKNVTII